METVQPDYHSQFGEDAILDKIFRDHSAGCCVEVGANDGITGSATYYFEKKGWDCLLIEPVPSLVEIISKNRNCKVCMCAASSEEGETSFFVADKLEALSGIQIQTQSKRMIASEGATVRKISVIKKTLDRIFREFAISNVDFITIDVEGHELEVLKGLSLETYRPRILIIEDNSNCMDDTILEYLEVRGYSNFRRTGVNDWYARKSDSEVADDNDVRAARAGRKREKLKQRIINRFKGINPYIPHKMKVFFAKTIDSVSRHLYW